MKNNGKNNIETPANLLIFAIFAFCVIATLLAGAGAYRRLSTRDSAAYEARTVTQYIATRVKGAECPEYVSLETVGNTPALCVRESGGYASYVYCYDGWLRELYMRDGAVASEGAGDRLMQVSSADFSLENGLLRYELQGSSGENLTGCVSVRGQEGNA